MRILIVEDEKALSRVLVKIFEKNYYSVGTVYTVRKLWITCNRQPTTLF